MKQVSKKQIVSKLRDAFRVEALESRVLLSADPILGQAALLAPDLLAHNADASDHGAHAPGITPVDGPGAAAPALPVALAPDPHLASLAALAIHAGDADTTAAQQSTPHTAAVQPDTLYLNQDNLGQYRDADNRIVLGHTGSNAQIVVGDAANSGNLVLDDSLVLLNPQAGGEIAIAQNLVLSGDAGLSITGSGHTTTISASSINTAFAYINDSVKIDGATATNHTIALTATAGDIQIGGSSAHSLNGDGLDPDDLLQLSATGNILVTGTVGNTDALEGFTITQANNVTFKGEVTVNGNFDIHASGTVTFEQSVHLTAGFFRITGANLVVFKGGVTVDGGGDIFLEGNEINFQTGETAVIGTGMLSLRPTNVALGIEVGGPPLENAAMLNIDNAEIATFASTFSKIVIGRQEGATSGYLAGAHADDLAGTVRIGAIQTPQQYTFRSALEVYGGSIVVEDFANPAYQFLVNGNLKLDAWNGISIYNQVEAHNSNIALYAQTGAVVQANAASNLDNLSSEPLRALDLQVHAGAGVRLPFAQVNSITVVNTGDGDILVNNLARDAASGIGGALRVDGVSQTSVLGDNITLSTSAGNLTINSAGSGVATVGSGNVSLLAGGGGSQILVGRAIAASGGAIALASSGQIALQNAGIVDNGAGGIALTSASAGISVARDIVSNGGLVSLNAATTIFMDSGTRIASLHPLADSGAVSLVAGGTVTVSTLAADGAITVRSNAGAIVDGLLGDGLNLDGDTAAAALSAATGIGSGNALQTRVAAVTLSNGTAGNVQLREATALRILGASVGGSGGNLVVTTLDGGIVVEGAIDTTGATGNLLLQSGEALEGTAADIAIRAGIASTNGSISIVSADGIVADDGAAGSAPLLQARGAARTLDLQADGAVTLEGQARLLTNNGNVRVDAMGGSLALGVVDAGTAAVSLRAAGSILDAQADSAAPGLNVTAGALRMQAGGDIGNGLDALEVQAGTLAVNAGGLSKVALGANATIGTVAGVRVNRVGSDGSVSDAQDAAQLSGIITDGDLLVDGADLLVEGPLFAWNGHVRVEASGMLLLNTEVRSFSGSVAMQAAYNLLATPRTHITSAAGTIDLESTGGSVTLGMESSVRTDAGNIRVAGAAGVTVSLLDARSNADRATNSLAGQAGWGAVSIVSGGAIAEASYNINGTDVYAGALRLNAAGAIGAGGALDIEAAVLSASGAGVFLYEASSVKLDSTGAIGVNRVLAGGGLDAVQRSDAAQAGLVSSAALVLQAGGAIESVAGSQVGAGGNLLLQAGGNLVLGADVSTTGATGNISLQAGGDIRQGAAIAATAAGQSIDLAAQGAITMAQGAVISSIGGAISLRAEGAIALALVDAGSGAVAINAGAAISDIDADGDSNVDIVASSLQLRAGTALGARGNALEIRTGTLSAEANGGAMFLAEADAITVGAVSVEVNRVDAAGAAAALTVASQSGLNVTGPHNLVVSAGGAMTVNAAVAARGGDLLLKSGGDMVLNATVASGVGALSLAAAGSLAQNAHVSGSSIDVEAGVSIAMADGVRASAGGSVRYATSGNLALGAIETPFDVSLVAGSISDSGGSDLDISASGLRMAVTNGAGSGAAHLQIAVNVLAASAGTGGLYLDEQDALTIGARTGSVLRVGTDGWTTVVVDQMLAGVNAGGNLVLGTGAGSLDVAYGVGAAGNLLLSAGGAQSDLTLNANIANSGGNSSLVAGRDLLQNANVTSAAAGKSFELRAGRDIVMAQAAASSANNGNILLAAGANVTVSSLNAGSGNVGIAATSGSIVDGDAAGDTAIDIVAGGLQLRAGNAIGSGANAIETNVVIATAQAGAGGVYLAETNALTLAGVTVQVNRVGATGAAVATTDAAQIGVSAQGGNVVLVSNGASLVVNGSVSSNGGNLLLQAAGGGMVLNAKVDAGGGALSLASGGNIAQKADILTSGAGTVDLQAARAINMDNGTAIRAAANVRVVAGTTMALGAIQTGGDVSLAATGILDAGGSETDVTAAVLRVAVTGAGAGFGAPGARIQTAVGSLAANVAGNGGIFIEQAGAIAIGAQADIGVRRVGADGSTAAVADAGLSGVTSGGALVLTSTGAIAVERVVAAAGDLLLAAGEANLVLDAAVSSAAGSISLGAGHGINQNADLRALAAGQSIELAAGSDIAMQAGSSSRAANLRYAAGGDIAVGLLDAASGGVSLAAGGAIVDAEAAQATQTVNIKAGALRMTAGAGIGAGNAIDTTVDSLAASASNGAIAIVDTDGLNVPAAGVTVAVQRIGADGVANALADAALTGVTAAGGSTSLAAATGAVVFGQAQQVGAGQDLELVGDELRIDQPLVGEGGTLAIRPANPAHDIRIGGSGFGDGGLYLSPALLANLAGGFDRVVIGGGAAAPGQVIHIDGSAGAAVFRDSLVLEASGPGSSVFLTGSLAAEGLDARGPLALAGAVTIATGNGDAAGGDMVFAQGIDAFETSASLVLAAGGDNVVVQGAVGANGALAGLTVRDAHNVSFAQDVSVNGDVTVNATGVVRFDGALHIAGGSLVIRGASQVIIGDIVLSGEAGEFIIEADTLVINGNVQGADKVALRPVDAGRDIVVGGAGTDGAFSITDSMLAHLSGAAGLVIGVQGGDGHAAADAGKVSIVATDFAALSNAPLQVFGSTVVVEASAGSLVAANGLVLDGRDGVVLHDSVSAVRGDVVVYSAYGAVQMDAGTTLQGSGAVTAQAAGNLVLAGVQGKHVVVKSGGTILDAAGDDAVNIVADTVALYGMGPQLGMGNAIEVQSPALFVQAPRGVVVQDTGPDGRTHFYVLDGATMYEAAVAVGDTVRHTEDPTPALLPPSLAPALAATPYFDMALRSAAASGTALYLATAGQVATAAGDGLLVAGAEGLAAGEGAPLPLLEFWLEDLVL